MSTPAGEPEATLRVDSDARPVSSRDRDAQFAPGTSIAGRYRIASILGSGGMGEVYRADDTRLNQPVALKFLPAKLARDPLLLARLHDEVRLGRQVAHPNVCRIYDIADADGAQFVAMEYVDGEDLARLLRRIGRLAHDKAVDIARGIAAGLLAAHAKGILHRDLKPANVMVDSRGEARIMDFGLALAAGEHDGVIAGTPAYMAPEQLEGLPATVQSDLYALGLVMYELFTGKRAHVGRTVPERVRDITSSITSPSEVIRDIDPAVERIILRCLANDPAQRPRSAREVIESLPGGDPLAAAMAAGETPSPRIVAAAGAEGSLAPRVAWTLLGATLVLVALMFVRAAQSGYLDLLGLTRPPEVQAELTSDLLRGLGLPRQPFRSYGFALQKRRTAWIYTHRQPWEQLRRGLPGATFWMREEPRPLVDERTGATSPKPTLAEPPQSQAGAIAVEVDPRGGLHSLRAIPEPSWKPRPLAWSALLAAAMLDDAPLQPETPRFVPPAFADARAAWRGTDPEDGTPIRVEAAAYRGTPVYFRIVAPWDEVDRTSDVPFGGAGFGIFMTSLVLAMVLVGAFLAWRNLRLRRGDRQGAWRVGAVIFVCSLVPVLVLADHEAVVAHEVVIFFSSLSDALVQAVLIAMLYLALEPYIRRRWPHRLIGWARLIAGNWRDPMVARDVLIGLLAGCVFTSLAMWGVLLRSWALGVPLEPHDSEVRLLDSALEPAMRLFQAAGNGVVEGLAFMALLMLLTIVLRRRALAVGGFFVILGAGFLAASNEPAVIPILLLTAALNTYVVARHGLLATAAMFTVFLSLFFIPLPEGIGWATARTIVAPLVIVVLALWAFRTSLGSQSPFSASLLDD